ncbi:AAA family ATPase [Vibrio sp.]|uniref:AAA family ATPase n=1 Tax=Vibrio sp. TaxID=678 RepID=UPI003D0FDBE5
MSKIYCLCGFVGAGKTTYAKKLVEQYHAFRFSPDEWMIPLFGEHMERAVFDQRLATLTELFKRSALDLLAIGVPVIFDFGFWTRADREAMRIWAAEQKLDCEMIYLDVDYETCCQRAVARNKDSKDDAFTMTPEMLALFWSWFEIPDQDEPVTVV